MAEKEVLEGLKDKIIGFLKGEKKVGLVLGGGAARGIAHVGVLKVLIENNVPIHMIAGTSSGALFGSLYAGGLSITTMEAAARRSGWNRLVRLAITRRGAVSGESMVKLVEESIGRRTFSDLAIPFAAVACDLRTGERIVLRQGDVAHAVHASSAIPGVFIPVLIEGRHLSDGMVCDNVPVDVAREMGADFIIAVDVIPKVVLDKDPDNVVEVVERALDIGVKISSKPIMSQADILIEPVIKNLSPFALNHADELINMGVEAANAVIPEIKRKLRLG